MSKPRKVVIELTELEARMLRLVVGNGWGDGDFAEWIGDAQRTRACQRAMAKLNKAVEQQSMG